MIQHKFFSAREHQVAFTDGIRDVDSHSDAIFLMNKRRWWLWHIRDADAVSDGGDAQESRLV
jgi:hypothetical protein